MSKDRYELVKVNYQDCPIKYQIPKSHRKKCFPFECKCDMFGDSKEQLINKITQVLFKDFLKSFKGARIDKASLSKFWQMQKKLATEIVEFIGVK